jgi:predicted transcriptional regulator of viral defense system
MVRKRSLEMLDRLVAAGRETFTSVDAGEILDLSPQATSNLLTRLVNQGLVDRVARGHYVIRPIGRLGTSAAAEETALAVAAVFSGRPHRIGYRSALAHHGLLVHPTRMIQVACPDLVRIPELSGRPLKVVRESPSIVDVGAIDAGHGARVSGVERALIDGARRVELVGGLDVLSEALERAAADLDVLLILDYAEKLGESAALRRLASVARVLDLEELADQLVENIQTDAGQLRANPSVKNPIQWTDSATGVVWSSTDLDTVRST